MSRIGVVCWVAMGLSLSSGLLAQEKKVVFFGQDGVNVSEEQAERISEIELEARNEINSLQQQLQVVKQKLALKQKDVETAKQAELTDGQKAILANVRRQRQEQEWRTRQINDLDYLTKVLPVLEKLRTAKSFSLLEGPARNRKDAAETPVDEASLERVGMHVFFKEPLSLSRSDKLTAVSIASDYRSFSAYQGGKFCGGFHPDANLRFVTAQGTVQFLVCFGCAEVKIIDGDRQFTAEIERDAYDALKSLCQRHFKHRK